MVMPRPPSVNGTTPPWKRPHRPDRLRAGPQVYGDLSISGDSWAVKPTSSIPYCTKIPRLLKHPKPTRMDPTFHISHGMADQAIKWLDNWKGLRDNPFFMYYTPGAVHAPIQVPKEWRDKYKGQFDEGWHVYRQQLLERQKKLGLVSEDAEMVDWPEVIPEWDSFSEEGKEYLAARWRSMPLLWNMLIIMSDGSSNI
jgi:hypothetical protein